MIPQERSYFHHVWTKMVHELFEICSQIGYASDIILR